MQRLLTQLDDRRRAQRLSHEAFARDVLDISPAYWSMVRRGLKPIGGAVVIGVLRAFPDLADVVVTAIFDDQAWHNSRSANRSTLVEAAVPNLPSGSVRPHAEEASHA